MYAHMMRRMATVTGEAGRRAADIISSAQRRHLPVLTLREASHKAGLSPEGWSKVIRTGRGRESTFVAMARVTGVEEEVREALGLPPAEVAPEIELPPMSLDERRAVLAYLQIKRAAEQRGA